MNEEEFLTLHKQYSIDNLEKSFFNYDDLSYLKLLEAGFTVIPLAAKRLRDYLEASSFDLNNDPWLSIRLLDELTNGKCLINFPESCMGQLEILATYIYMWAKTENIIK